MTAVLMRRGCEGVVPIEDNVLVAEVLVVRKVHIARTVASRQILIEEVTTEQ